MSINMQHPIARVLLDHDGTGVASSREAAIANSLSDSDDESERPHVCNKPPASSATCIVPSTPLQIATPPSDQIARVAPTAAAFPAPPGDAVDVQGVVVPVVGSRIHHAIGVASSNRTSDADDNWKRYRTRFVRAGLPSEHGIIDMRPVIPEGRTVCEGRRLSTCTGSLMWLLRGSGGQVGRNVEHEIGLCYDAMYRWRCIWTIGKTARGGLISLR